MTKKRFSDLGPAQKETVMLSVAIQLGLLAAALVDIYRRQAAEIRGNKKLWAAAAFINFVGPISYFLYGRKRQGASPDATAAGLWHPHVVGV